MPRPANRSQLMDYFGAIQRNPMWSWCAVNEDERKVYLSVWTDHKEVDPSDGKPYYIVQEPGWGVNQDTGGKSPARNDHDEKLAKIFQNGYEAYGYCVEAKDSVHPRVKSLKRKRHSSSSSSLRSSLMAP